MARVRLSSELEAMYRRFGEGPLSGDDLEHIRLALGLTQEQLGAKWGMSRRQISFMENKDAPDAKTCDAYRGMMVCSLLGREQDHQPDEQVAA